MRAYQLVCNAETGKKTCFSETQKSARAKRREMMESLGLKLDQITIEQVEIPTKKTELLEWMNSITLGGCSASCDKTCSE